MIWGAKQDGRRCDWQADRRTSVSADLQALPDGNNRMQMVDEMVGGTSSRQREGRVLNRSPYH